MCDLNTHIEFFHSLSPSFLLFLDERLLLLDSNENNCPLYTGSADSTSCLTGSTSSIGSIVGGVIGGIIAGAVIALGIAALVIVIILKRRKSDTKELDPHPTTSKFPGKGSSGLVEAAEQRYAGKQNPSDDAGYEFLPVFNKGPTGDATDAEYDIPQLALSGLPSAPAAGQSEYEVMDLMDTNTGTAGGGKESRFSKRKKAPAAPKGSKQKEKKEKEGKPAQKGKKAGHESVEKKGRENAEKKGYENVFGKKGYENVDMKDDDGGTPKYPLAQKKFELSAPKVSGSSITPVPAQSLPSPPPLPPPTIDAKKGPAKGVKGEVGKGVKGEVGKKSSQLQAAASPPSTESQEVGRFKAMREKFAANFGGGAAVAGESPAGKQQPQDGKKRWVPCLKGPERTLHTMCTSTCSLIQDTPRNKSPECPVVPVHL